MQKPEETNPHYRYNRAGSDWDRNQGYDMKFAACFAFTLPLALAILVPLPASAATEQCRLVQEKAERVTCYQRQEASRAARQKVQAAREAEQSKPLEPMSSDDETMARAIRGICRGC